MQSTSSLRFACTGHTCRDAQLPCRASRVLHTPPQAAAKSPHRDEDPLVRSVLVGTRLVCLPGARCRGQSGDLGRDRLIPHLKSRNTSEETFSNVRIDSDGDVAAVSFDYSFLSNDQPTNWGKECWHGEDRARVESYDGRLLGHAARTRPALSRRCQCAHHWHRLQSGTHVQRE